MRKSKNFFFTAAITITMLFILGNWATARATGVTLIDATPIPTGTPIDDPDSPFLPQKNRKN